jgi:hypothetical protein
MNPLGSPASFIGLNKCLSFWEHPTRMLEESQPQAFSTHVAQKETPFLQTPPVRLKSLRLRVWFPIR